MHLKRPLKNATVRTLLRRLIDRFCDGSAARLLLGLVDHGVIDRRELRALEKQLAERGQERPSRG